MKNFILLYCRFRFYTSFVVVESGDILSQIINYNSGLPYDK